MIQLEGKKIVTQPRFFCPSPSTARRLSMLPCASRTVTSQVVLPEASASIDLGLRRTPGPPLLLLPFTASRPA